ncbi:MAG TPA: molybdenum cofactor biosynthesis protein MoaE [Polyangia bacterium]|jgi:molybdopterin synthase catalytic subunit
MRVRVRYFAVVREILGLAEETLELPAGARLADVLDAVLGRDARLTRLRPVVRAARNLALAADATPLADGDEVALIPPVMGGSGAPARWRVSAAPISIDEAVALVRHPGAGAVVLFVGTVRDEHEGRRVERLEYEAYVEMAERVLADVGAALEAGHAGVRVAILHRVGSLAVGDSAVIIACSAPHRAPAFDACREAIERLKREVPVWKKEYGEGGATWLGVGP